MTNEVPSPDLEAAIRKSRWRAAAAFSALGALFVAMPFLFWHQTWFGRQISDQEIGRCLQDDQHPRKIQHALSQVSDRLAQGDPGVKLWYPQIAALVRHPEAVIRSTAVWVMGQDNRHEAFHQALLQAGRDPDLMVRRNAALALVRFGDASGRAELVQMLLPYGVRAPEEGRVSIQVQAGQRVGQGTLLARILPDRGGKTVEVRSPVAGSLESVAARDGSRVAAGERLVAVDPEFDQVWEALRGLYLVGRPEDLPPVERYAAAGLPERVRRQAMLTAGAIRTRSERTPTR